MNPKDRTYGYDREEVERREWDSPGYARRFIAKYTYVEVLVQLAVERYDRSIGEPNFADPLERAMREIAVGSRNLDDRPDPAFAPPCGGPGVILKLNKLYEPAASDPVKLTTAFEKPARSSIRARAADRDNGPSVT